RIFTELGHLYLSRGNGQGWAAEPAVTDFAQPRTQQPRPFETVGDNDEIKLPGAQAVMQRYAVLDFQFDRDLWILQADRIHELRQPCDRGQFRDTQAQLPYQCV